MKARSLITTTVLGWALYACTDAPTSPPKLNRSSAEIQDGGHNNGAAHFFFASPITKDPTPTGKFNGAARPQVLVCEWTGSDCSSVVAQFTVGTGTGGSTVKVEPGAERYSVNWNTGQCRTGACVLDPAKTYRIRVLVGGLEAGHADIDVVSNQAQAKNVNTNEFIPLVDGKLLQIRFRIEDGLSLKAPNGNGLTFHPNSEKYRDAGAHPATGRDGSATLQARALLGKDGSTILELTTAALDVAGAAPGNIDHVQLKLLDADKNVALTQNYTDLNGGGAWSKTYGALAPHQNFQVQTNISGIDASRTDVVTAEGSVQRRPDLAAIELSAPNQVVPDTRVSLSATVAELNRDVGATANCVLYVEGNEVDRADGIWVDAGSSVNCQFTAQFTGSGDQTATVRVEGVVPGDDDMANNSASATVRVARPNDFYFGASAYAYDYRDYKYSADQTVTSSDNTLNSTYHYEVATGPKYQLQNAGANAWLSETVDFPLAHLETSHSSGGNALGTISYDNLPADYTYSGSSDDSYSGHYSFSESRAFRQELTPAGRLSTAIESYSEAWTGGTGRPAGEYHVTYFSMSRYAAEASYLSHETYSFVDERTGQSYSWVINHPYEEFVGATPPLGDDYLITGALRGAGEGAPTYTLRATIPLTTTTTVLDPTPVTETSSYWDYNYSRTVTYQYAHTTSGTIMYTTGFTSGTPTSSP